MPSGNSGVPIFDGLIKSQGMCFARPNKTTLEEAVRWAEVVHFLMPFPLSIEGEKVAVQLGFPIRRPSMSSRRTSPLPSGLETPAASTKRFTRDSKPSFTINSPISIVPASSSPRSLKRTVTPPKLHVISNGIDSDFVYRKKDKSPELQGKIVILMIGRLSAEKRQDVLIDAIDRCAHRDQIQLVLAGRGPNGRRC